MGTHAQTVSASQVSHQFWSVQRAPSFCGFEISLCSIGHDGKFLIALDSEVHLVFSVFSQG